MYQIFYDYLHCFATKIINYFNAFLIFYPTKNTDHYKQKLYLNIVNLYPYFP